MSLTARLDAQLGDSSAPEDLPRIESEVLADLLKSRAVASEAGVLDRWHAERKEEIQATLVVHGLPLPQVQKALERDLARVAVEADRIEGIVYLIRVATRTGALPEVVQRFLDLASE